MIVLPGFGVVGDGFNGGVGMQTITYDLNGGEGWVPVIQYFEAGKTVNLTVLDYPRDLYRLDHIFDGWVDSDTGKLYAQGERVSFDKSVVLRASFKDARDK